MHYKPTQTLNKVSVSTFAAAVVGVLVWLLETYGGTKIPVEIVGLLTTIAVFAAGWLTPISPGELESVPHTAPTTKAQAALVDLPRIDKDAEDTIRRIVQSAVADALTKPKSGAL